MILIFIPEFIAMQHPGYFKNILLQNNNVISEPAPVRTTSALAGFHHFFAFAPYSLLQQVTTVVRTCLIHINCL